jgi:hypothetical protein
METSKHPQGVSEELVMVRMMAWNFTYYPESKGMNSAASTTWMVWAASCYPPIAKGGTVRDRFGP